MSISPINSNKNISVASSNFTSDSQGGDGTAYAFNNAKDKYDSFTFSKDLGNKISNKNKSNFLKRIYDFIFKLFNKIINFAKKYFFNGKSFLSSNLKILIKKIGR